MENEMMRFCVSMVCLAAAASGNVAGQTVVRPKASPTTLRPQQPAAKVTTFSCTQVDARPGIAPSVITLRVNYATAVVEQLAPSGKAYTNRIAPDARISDNAIVWSAKLMDTGLARPVPMTWAGTIDRLSGAAWDEFARDRNWYRTNYMCRVAARIN